MTIVIDNFETRKMICVQILKWKWVSDQGNGKNVIYKQLNPRIKDP